VRWKTKEPRHLYSGALPLDYRSLVKQISPDKNVNCHCTAPSFTVSLEPVDFVTLCPLIPETQPYMTFLGFGILRRSTSCFHAVVFVGSQFCTRASFPHFLADLQLPSASSYHHPLNGWCRFSYRGLSPHKFTPMLGVHKALAVRRSARTSLRAAEARRCL